MFIPATPDQGPPELLTAAEEAPARDATGRVDCGPGARAQKLGADVCAAFVSASPRMCCLKAL